MARCIVLRLVKSLSCVGVGLALSIVVLQTGCKRPTEQSTTEIEPKGDEVAATNEADDMELAYKGMDGADVRSAGKNKAVALPADFPADVAIYPKATPKIVATKDQEIRVNLISADSLEKVGAFYKDRIKKDGWKVNATDLPQQSMLVGKKKERELVVLIVSQKETATRIQITITSKKQPDVGTGHHG